ncbi:CFA45-like protein [Mya arenaria]|uniref:Cilia- and flagella-associated protein 45 n=1 Tax=Mya arenaria TaxID=6604 RepID=A0ABY7E8U6_MYAAR|nr:CFA45-like protein [Mya arenaria]
MNPMYEGHMQHDAQEFLRCLQCYFQDAEKEVQKFYTQLPTKLSPKPMNHIMQRLLNIVQIIDKNMGMKASGMESDTVLEVGGETPEAEKVKVKLFPKPEEETRTAKSPSKVHLVPHEADTAGVVDKLIGEASLPSASLEHHSEDQGKKEDGTSEVIGDKPESVNNNCAAGKRKQKKADVSKHFEKGKKKDQKRPRKETSKELIIEDTSEKFNGKGIKTYGASKKRLGMRGAVVRKTSEELFDEIQEQFDDIKSDSDCNGKENEAARAINRTDPGQNADVNDDMKKDVATKDGPNKWESEKEVIDAGKLIGPLTKLNSFQNAFSAFVNGTHVKVEDDSDSDNGDIVAEKKRAKLLHESPRRSPRKTKSEMVRPSPGKAPVSKLAFVSNSESTVQSVKSKLDFSQPPYRSLSLKRTAENCSQNASVFSENKTCSDAVNNSENTEDVEMDDSDCKISNENVSHCNDKRDTQHLNNFSLTSSQSLLPVVILENCDYVLRENGMSVSAAYASQCLTPRKEGPREDSNNYLKQRTPQLPTEIHDEVEFKKALEEMFNSPVKSRSKYDMVERNFQEVIKFNRHYRSVKFISRLPKQNDKKVMCNRLESNSHLWFCGYLLEKFVCLFHLFPAFPVTNVRARFTVFSWGLDGVQYGLELFMSARTLSICSTVLFSSSSSSWFSEDLRVLIFVNMDLPEALREFWFFFLASVTWLRLSVTLVTLDGSCLKSAILCMPLARSDIRLMLLHILLKLCDISRACEIEKEQNTECRKPSRETTGMMMLRTRCSTCECARERQEEFHDISVPVRVDSGDSDTEEDLVQACTLQKFILHVIRPVLIEAPRDICCQVLIPSRVDAVSGTGTCVPRAVILHGDMCSQDSDTPWSCCSLLDLIEASTEVEKLVKDNKYFCEECQSYTEAERSIHYDILPNILTLHLKRFCADPNSLIKINDRVEIPQTLPCLRYKCSPACLRPDHGYKLYGIVTHSGASLTSGHYLAYVRALPKTDRTLPLYPDIKLEPNIEREKDATKTTDKFPMTRKKAGVTTKLPARFTDNVIANTKVKAFEKIAPKKKVDLVDSLLPARAFSTEWFECDDETIRVFDQEDFLKLLSGDSGALLGTPYLLFYHKATLLAWAYHRILGVARDYLYICVARDYLYTGVARDYLYTCVARDYLYTGVASGYLYTCVARDYLYTGVASGYLYTHVARDYLYIHAARDYLYTRVARDFLYTHVARDYLYAHVARDYLYTRFARPYLYTSFTRHYLYTHRALRDVDMVAHPPGSAISAVGSSSSASSRRGKTKSYRVVSNHSQIDESLFGQPNHVAKRQELLENKWSGGDNRIEDLARERSARRNKKNKKNNKETVQVITKDLIRNLIVPTEDPSGQSVILPRHEYYRIIQNSRVITKSEREQMDNRIKEGKERAMLILNAKCHAIRDAQILEKGQVRGEMDEEEKRLDVMMEVDRQNAIRVQEEIEKKRKEERLIGAAKLLEQITENEQDRLLELERKDQENVHMQRQVEKMMDEDRVMLDKRKREQEALRTDLNLANEEILARREIKKQQEKAEEHKVIEYMKQKAEREAAFEEEQQRIRIQKEKETARLRALQERARDEQADRDALRAKRAQEQAEREWRKKEAEEGRKKAETEAMLIDARKNQMNQKEHYLAVQAQRERNEFERVLRAQKELVEKERREEQEAKKKRHGHADDVRAQIREKEQVRISERNAFFEEGVKLDEEARARRAKLEDVKKKKLEHLRAAGIPDRYVTHVAHKECGNPREILEPSGEEDSCPSTHLSMKLILYIVNMTCTTCSVHCVCDIFTLK